MLATHIQNAQIPLDTVWTVPTVLTHVTWQAAQIECLDIMNIQLSHAGKLTNFALDWQYCKQIDSSALAFILALKRHFHSTQIIHNNLSPQLNQLAHLYEVQHLVGFTQ